MAPIIRVSGEQIPCPKLTFDLDRVIDAIQTSNGFRLTNYDGKQIVSDDRILQLYVDNNFIRLGTTKTWINPDFVMVAITDKSPVFLRELRTRFFNATYQQWTALMTPHFIKASELTEISRSTFVRLKSAIQLTRKGVLTVGNRTYQMKPFPRRFDELIRDIRALGWIKLTSGTFVNPLDFAVLYEGDGGWIDMEFGRRVQLTDMTPEDRGTFKTLTPWVKIPGCSVNPTKILSLKPDCLSVQCVGHTLAIDKPSFAKLKKIVDSRIVQP